MMIWRKIRQIDFVERLTVSQYINSMEQSNETWSYSKISVKSTIQYLTCHLEKKTLIWRKNDDFSVKTVIV